MLLVNLDDKRQGVAVIDGMVYRVTGTYGPRGKVLHPATSDQRIVTIDLILNAVLDELQQRKRIEMLELQLQAERDRLEEIRRTLNGEED